jgi:N,N-dimethylformamidase
MYRIDPRRVELAIEFKNRPLGLHSPDLHAVLVAMRRMPIQGKHVLVATTPNRTWRLAVMEGEPLRPRLLDGPAFTDPLQAEWVVFKHRWRALTGEALDVD